MTLRGLDGACPVWLSACRSARASWSGDRGYPPRRPDAPTIVRKLPRLVWAQASSARVEKPLSVAASSATASRSCAELLRRSALGRSDGKREPSDNRLRREERDETSLSEPDRPRTPSLSIRAMPAPASTSTHAMFDCETSTAGRSWRSARSKIRCASAPRGNIRSRQMMGCGDRSSIVRYGFCAKAGPLGRTQPKREVHRSSRRIPETAAASMSSPSSLLKLATRWATSRAVRISTTNSTPGFLLRSREMA
ncbi:hypothetical protein SAMN04488115_111173 [Bosea lathyri]|uniref:Uncharacterized protein n=1 Tax=Bosea lathyri TaxID=1036778 RepID=A0A1H6CQW9_9HYPH|nr:hypothetical protein SAMN04488115_111173 [Bosea lathyri]